MSDRPAGRIVKRMTATISESRTSTSRERQGSRLPLAGLAGAALAAAGNLAVFGVARAAGVSLVGQFDPKAPAATLPVAMVVIASFVPALVGTGVLAIMNRFLEKPSRAFAVLAGVVGVFSMGGPATLQGADGATKATLAVMHVVAAAAIAWALLRGGRPKA